jgi:hypothetical protein
MDTLWTHFAQVGFAFFLGFARFFLLFPSGAEAGFPHMETGILKLIWGKKGNG